MTAHADATDVALRKAVSDIADRAPDAPPFESFADDRRRAGGWRTRGVVAALATTAAIVGGVVLVDSNDEPTEEIVSSESLDPTPATQPDTDETPAPGPPLSLEAVVESTPWLAAVDTDATPALYRADGTPSQVAAQYLVTRLGADAVDALGITVDEAAADGDLAVVRWAWSRSPDGADGDDEALAGLVLLRQSDAGREVIAATIDGVEAEVTYDGANVNGVVTTATGQTMFIDVVDAAGRPLPGAMNPDGVLTLGTGPVGTAGGPQPPGQDSIEFGAYAPSRTHIVVRVSLVGGTVLGVAELPIASPEPSADLACGPALPVPIAYLAEDGATFRVGEGHPGQLVTIAAFDGLEVETRWPATMRPEYSSGVVSPSPGEIATSSAEDGRHEILISDAQGRLPVAMIETLPAPDVAEGCEVIEFRITRAGETLAHFGWHLTDLAPWPIRAVGPYVADVRPNAAAPPDPVACDAPPGGTPPPNIGGESPVSTTRETPVQALALFLATDVAETFAASGYVELQLTPNTYVYGVPLDRGTADEWVTLVTVERTNDGWLATEYAASGC